MAQCTIDVATRMALAALILGFAAFIQQSDEYNSKDLEQSYNAVGMEMDPVENPQLASDNAAVAAAVVDGLLERELPIFTPYSFYARGGISEGVGGDDEQWNMQQPAAVNVFTTDPRRRRKRGDASKQQSKPEVEVKQPKKAAAAAAAGEGQIPADSIAKKVPPTTSKVDTQQSPQPSTPPKSLPNKGVGGENSSGKSPSPPKGPATSGKKSIKKEKKILAAKTSEAKKQKSPNSSNSVKSKVARSSN